MANYLNVWLVWSNEHGGFWAPDDMGYVRSIREAGRYTEIQARVRCRSGKLDPDGKPEEVMVLAPEAVRAGLDQLSDDPLALRAEIRRLRTRYEMPGQWCHSDHENILPLALWDCPLCTEAMRARLLDTERQIRAIARMNCEHATRDARESGVFLEQGDDPVLCKFSLECDCLTCCMRLYVREKIDSKPVGSTR
jgi:hypothetical protein